MPRTKTVRASTVRKHTDRIKNLAARMNEAEDAIGLLQKLVSVRGIIVAPPATPESLELAEEINV